LWKPIQDSFGGIDLVIGKTDSILNLREHLIALLTPVDPPTADLRKNTKIN